MTCKHSKYDPACSSYQSRMDTLQRDYAREVVSKAPPTPDAKNYHVEDVMECGRFLVMKVTYPSCRDCSFEGTKVMVFENVRMVDAIKWKEIDPHFRDSPSTTPYAAPGPIARFPASEQGWSDAKDFATKVCKQ